MGFLSKFILDSECVTCKNHNKCIIFPCRHSFCQNCYYTYYMAKISRLNSILEQNPKVLYGLASYIGCPAYCKESALTVSPDELKELFAYYKNWDLTNVIDICSSFLLGIKSYFFKCSRCNKITSSIKENVMCKCQEGAFNMSGKPIGFGFDRNIVESNFLNRPYGDMEENKRKENEDRVIFKQEKGYLDNRNKPAFPIPPFDPFEYSNVKILTPGTPCLEEKKIERLPPPLNIKPQSFINYSTVPVEKSTPYNDDTPSEEKIKILIRKNNLFIPSFTYTGTVGDSNPSSLPLDSSSEFLLIINKDFKPIISPYQNLIKYLLLSKNNEKQCSFFTLARACPTKVDTFYLFVASTDMVTYSEIFTINRNSSQTENNLYNSPKKYRGKFLSQDPTERAKFFLEKYNLLDVFPYTFKERICKNESPGLFSNCDEYLIGLKNDLKADFKYYSGDKRIELLSKENYKNYKYFTIAKAVIITEDQKSIVVSEEDMIYFNEIFLLYSDS
ncbi:hypothetical protein SteCoe_15602 [Stentor coeruleus]|uniref:RING-type domain-containing protein n=1 Tax=Stentor coeruleus TaxID=5963 RepID=A0A1R2C348_9CILI|nr:hypothetical protein SteCoe_15602 [Stentor coeruleus]